jgi:hypothetical protein
MLSTLSQRVLTLLQLTRMALVFTAVADGLCTLLLAARARADAAGTSLGAQVSASQVFWAVAVSAGLYGFGMSLNDIIDRRRDAQIAATRPLPSGRIGVTTAHVVCGLLLAGAGGRDVLLARPGRARAGVDEPHPRRLDGDARVVLRPGGQVPRRARAAHAGADPVLHALVPAPHVPLLWHPLLLLNHVAVLSAVAYHWEEKRPPLTRSHWAAVLGGLLAIDVAAVAFLVSRREATHPALRIGPELLLPLLAVAGFVLLAHRVRRRAARAGRPGRR